MKSNRISGTAGVGKTHIASSIGNVAVDKGIKIFYITSLNLLLALNNQDKNFLKIFDNIKECRLMIIDEFAYTKLNDSASQKLYHYLTKINRIKSLIIITNKSVEEIPEYFSEKLLAITLTEAVIQMRNLCYSPFCY